MRISVLAMVLAGGEGKRLFPLTDQRAKPAVPFGGKYRIIDFVLSNFVNSGITSVFVLTQFKSQSLMEHIINGWNISSTHGKGRFIIPVPAQMQTQDRRWYSGTADAIYQNIHLIEDFNPDIVAIFGGDHIYRMDISQMIDFHIKKGALATVAAIPVPMHEANQFGIIQADNDWRIMDFHEKPENPVPVPGDPTNALASMGNYIFNSKEILSLLRKDCTLTDSSHDFGKDIIPSLVDSKRLFAYNFHWNKIPGHHHRSSYWRDVGNLKAFYEANMDLRSGEPELDLYNKQWPIYNYHFGLPPAKFVHNEEVGRDGLPRIGKAVNSLVCDGCIISGSTVTNSVLFNSVHVHSYSTIQNSILLNDVEIREHCRLRNVIIDKHVDLPEGTVIGYNRKEDEEKYYVVDLYEHDGSWLTVIPKNRDNTERQLAKVLEPIEYK
ncbi:MAG: glucose-1-phosphate adenylyltransferase [Lentisphaerae bacterium GWF2_44_16]|nr:MAG: glucose-1-phosphate adenylyltransferase [Lentisphaerae bacterium GWF2_44_16]